MKCTQTLFLIKIIIINVVSIYEFLCLCYVLCNDIPFKSMEEILLINKYKMSGFEKEIQYEKI